MTLALGVTGEGGAGQEFDRAVDVAQVGLRLRARLHGLMSDENARTLTRRNATNLLTILSECLDPLLHKPLGALDTGEKVVGEHRAVDLLNQLIDALGDLDNGKTHEVFRSASHGPNRSLSAARRRQDAVWLDTVEIVQRARGLPRRKKAEQWFARALTKAGKTRDGEPITQALLKSLRDRQNRRKRH